MSSSQQSHKQIILEMAQATGEVSILGRTYYWFFPDKYAKRLFGDKCNKELLQKLKSRSSTRIMKVILDSSIILSFGLGFGVLIPAMFLEGTQKFQVKLCSFCIVSTLWVHTQIMFSRSEPTREPLDAEDSIQSLLRIEKIWSRRLWRFAFWPNTAILLAGSYLFAKGKSFNFPGLIELLKSAPA